MESYKKLKELVNDLDKDVEKVNDKLRGHRAASIRVRRGLMEIKKHVHEMRQEILKIK